MKLRRMVEDKKCCGMRYAVCAAFFHPTEWNRQRIAIIERCRIAHRTTQQGGDAGPPRLKTFHSVWITGSMNEVKKKGEKKRRNRGKRRGRERERERKKVTYTHTLSRVRCVISEMANENGERRLWSRNGIACPTFPRKITLWISAWLAGRKKKKRKKGKKMIRWYELSRW